MEPQSNMYHAPLQKFEQEANKMDHAGQLSQ